MGDTLGGQPKDQSCYEDGKVLYDRVRERDFFREGIGRLRRADGTRPAGSDHVQRGQARAVPPDRADRTGAGGRGIAVAHIDENDCLIGQDEALGRRTGGQLSLLDDPEFKSRKRYKKTAGPGGDSEDD